MKILRFIRSMLWVLVNVGESREVIRQTDFWFKESLRLFDLAQSANERGDYDEFNRIRDQHRVVQKRYFQEHEKFRL